jgi:hypothetical protein
MMTAEDTLGVYAMTAMVILMVLFVFWMIYQTIMWHIELNRDKKNREEFLRNLKVGDKFMSDVQLINEDPFEEKQNLITIEVLDIKTNKENTVWTKVKWSDDNITTMQAMQIYEDFTKI